MKFGEIAQELQSPVIDIVDQGDRFFALAQWTPPGEIEHAFQASSPIL